MRRFVTPLLLLGTLLFVGLHPAMAQERDVRGTVVDATTGDPLPGVNIVLQGTSFGTATDLDGDYEVTVPGPDAVLVYSFVGYIPYETRVGNQAVLNVSLEEDVALIDEIVVVGYGTQRRGDVTSSIAILDVDDVNVGQVTNVDEMIQGRVAGVQVLENNGEPGAGISIRIRGGTSISASNDPLYVIDGVPIDNENVTPGGVDAGGGTAPPGRNPLNLLNPSDIESISVLKDAAATAIYGSRGANGVVLITTKSGVQGRVSVNYEGRTSVASASNQLDLVTGDRYRQFVEEQVAARNLGYDDDGNLIDIAGGPGGVFNEDGEELFPNGTADIIDGLGSASTDFQDAVLQTGISHQHNLSFSGGTSNTQYRASLSYLNQEGVIISSGLERVTARLNANNQSFDGRLRLGLNLTSALSADDYVAYENTAGFEGGLFTNVYDFNPTFPVEDADSGDGFFETGDISVRNPVALARQIDDSAETTRTLGNISAELDLIEGLTAQVNLGGDRSVSRRAAYFPIANPVGEVTTGLGAQQDLQRSSITLQTLLTYRKAIQETHNFDLLGGYEFNEFYNESFGVQSQNFASDALGADNVSSGGTIVPGNAFDQNGTYSFKETNRLISFFSRANYNLRETFYLSGSLRYDGSSRFGIDNKWALFPAVSGAVRISQLSFMEGNEMVSDLRLRAGYGIVGNQTIPNYLSLALLEPNPDSRAVLGGQVFTGFSPRQLANPDLKWEEKREFTVGLDYGLFDGRAFGSLEFYRNTTDNLLLEVAVPIAPVATRVDNIGSLRNTGVDLSLDAYAIEQDDMTLQFGVVFNTNSNEIVDLGGRDQIFTGSVSGRGQSGQNALLLTPGESFPVFYGAEFVEVNAEGDQVFNDYDAAGNLVGTTTSPDAGDRQIIGDPRADFSYGFRTKFNWKSFGISAFFRGEQGRELFNNTALVFQTKSAAAQGRGFLAAAFDDPDGLREAPIYSSRWIEDASFLKLDNVTLEYNIAPEMFGRVSSYVQNARVYLSVDNVFVLSPYSGYDPEVNTNAQVGLIPATGIDYTNYPVPRTFTVGINLGF